MRQTYNRTWAIDQGRYITHKQTLKEKITGFITMLGLVITIYIVISL